MTKFHTDSFYAQGHGHRVCQDYAEVELSTVEQVTIALSDGCSSSPNTDFGARFLVRKAMENARNLKDGSTDLDLNFIVQGAEKARIDLCLPARCNDATLLIARHVGSRIIVDVWGDGVIFYKGKSGVTYTIEVEYEDNTPAYPSYYVYNLQRYLSGHGERVITYKSSELATQWVRTPVTEQEYGVQFILDADAIDMLLLFSDGIQSFRTAKGEVVPSEDVLNELTKFKNTTGLFLVRRMKRFLKDCAENFGWIHDDDLSVVGMVATD